jgi:predicted DNA-binding transcriptional regulator YafY
MNARTRGRARIARQWALVRALTRFRVGATIAQLVDELETSRATVYRDLETLREAGVPIETVNVNGGARYKLANCELPALQPTISQIAALRFARRALGSLEGSSVLEELDALLAGKPTARTVIDTPRKRNFAPNVVRDLEKALDQHRRVRIRYRGMRDREAKWRLVDPLALRLAGDHLYLLAHDDAARAPRTFKVVRITHTQVLRDRAKPHDVDVEQHFEHSVKVWNADPIDVAVWIDAEQRIVDEYPLHEKQTTTREGAGVLVRARVSGIPEAMRWTLSWGQQATAREPKELVEAVRAELEGALAGYQTKRLNDRATPASYSWTVQGQLETQQQNASDR